MIVAMEVIAFGLHKDDLSDNFTTAAWDSDSKNSANSLLHEVTGFHLIVYQHIYLVLPLNYRVKRWT